jgi:hypothetical protein
MPLSERTERALKACYDASPRRDGRRPCNPWLNRSARPVARCSTTTWKLVRAPVPMSAGHEDFADLWARNQAHAPDPHAGPYLEQCTSFIRAGWASALEHHLSTEEERRTLPYFRETARPARREWLAVAFFKVDGRDWCLPVFRGNERGPFTPEDARRLAPIGPHVAKIVSLAEKFAAFAHVETLRAGASELGGARHRCHRARNANESACAKSAWRGLQSCPGSSGRSRSRQ